MKEADRTWKDLVLELAVLMVLIYVAIRVAVGIGHLAVWFGFRAWVWIDPPYEYLSWEVNALPTWQQTQGIGMAAGVAILAVVVPLVIFSRAYYHAEAFVVTVASQITFLAARGKHLWISEVN